MGSSIAERGEQSWHSIRHEDYLLVRGAVRSTRRSFTLSSISVLSNRNNRDQSSLSSFFPSILIMAGGTSIWIGKEARTDPKQIFNLRLLYLLVTIAWAGCFYGFDSGNIGGILTLKSFENAFGLTGLDKTGLAERKVQKSRPTLAASTD